MTIILINSKNLFQRGCPTYGPEFLKFFAVSYVAIYLLLTFIINILLKN